MIHKPHHPPGQTPKNRDEITALYKAGKISFIDAVYYLARLGMSPDDAGVLVSKLISDKYNKRE